VNRHPHDPQCIFCKIVGHEAPASVILETEDVMVFLDAHPVNKGHVLLVPKAHHADLADLPEAVAGHAGSLLPGLCRAVRKATGADGFNVVVNSGRAAGQTVDHGHWHVIPRFHDDAVKWPWPRTEYLDDDLGQLRFSIARELNLNLVED